VTVFVGPAGVGKTTTAVKLAVLNSLPRGRKIGLMTLDDQRIGAVDQLRIFAEILGLPLVVVTSAGQAARAMAEFQSFERVIVDTPGISPGEEPRRAELNRILAEFKAKEVHLLLSAAMREKEMLRVIDGWRGCGLTHLGFTRLDEADTWGSLLNLQVQTQLPVSFWATGPRIPEDLVPGGMDLLIERLLPAGERRESGEDPIGSAVAPSATGAGATRFVANRNSDLYHLPGCKWTRKIKAEHLLAFATLQEAESGHFRPCRDCAPHASPAAAGPPGAQDSRRASGRR
jgi:flagellar biosynthesis GTPase FlhF